MKADTFIVTYARTLLEVADEKGELEGVREEAEFFTHLETDPRLRVFRADSLTAATLPKLASNRLKVPKTFLPSLDSRSIAFAIMRKLPGWNSYRRNFQRHCR